MEVPVTRIIEGFMLENIINKDSIKNPDSLNYYIEIREKIY
jgi:hypothetical protein